MNEIWQDIPGYEGWYQASNQGRFKRIKKQMGTRAGNILKGTPIDKMGRIEIMLSCGPNRKRYKAHRLTMLTFVGPCPEGKEVNHINGKPSDNRLINLEYVTRSENMFHAYKIGLRKSPNHNGENHPHNKLADSDVLEIRRMYATGNYFYREIGKAFGITPTMVGYIVTRHSWKHI